MNISQESKCCQQIEDLYGAEPDLHSSSPEYKKRFEGKLGAFLLNVQAQALHAVMPKLTRTSVLDVGGGHGQIVDALEPESSEVSVYASSEAAVGTVNNKAAKIIVGPLDRISACNGNFDVLTCFRILPHYQDWRVLVRELCAKAKVAVVIDYPLWSSVNALGPMLFSFKNLVEKNTRHYSLFSELEIELEFAKHGFALHKTEKQFFFPMALHRALRSPKVSSVLEHAAKLIWLTNILGSPAVSCFIRK